MTTSQMPHAAPPPNQPPAQAKKKPGRARKAAGYVGAGVLGLIIGTSAGGSDDTSTASSAAPATSTVTVTEPAPAPVTVTAPAPAPVTVTAAPPPPPEPAGPGTTIDGDGTYVVGEDIAPGTYRTEGGPGCYWARLADFNGDFDSIITNGFGDGQQVVNISANDAAFEASGCGTWSQ